jgi:c-di-GMP-binding flagellar brake protein YcgR
VSHTVIRSTERAYTLLARLRDQHTLILLHTRRGQPHPSLSMLLSADPDQGTLILDAPVDLDRLDLEPGSDIRVTANLQGVDIRFHCRFDAVIEHEGDDALKLDWPTEVKYLERRSEFRVRLSGAGAGLELVSNEDDTVSGQIIDLSLGGFGALVEDSEFICENEVLDCVLELNDHCLSVRAEIRRKSEPSSRGKCHIGACFVELDSRDRRQLEKIVARLEREAIRADPTR